MSKDRISRLCEYIDKNKAKNYPIHNSILSTETDYIKNSYFKMLAVILEQGQEIFDSQRILFERQIAGVECDYQATDYFRQALEIEIEEYVNFTNECKEREIRYRFIFDAMLLSSVETYNDEQTRLVANFAEALKIEKDELKYMALLAKAVLEQNLSAYVTAEENRSFSVPNSVVKEYIGVLIKGNVCQNDNMTLIHSTVPSDMNTEKLDIVKKAETPIIKLSNVQLSLEQYELVFEGYEFVILENCVFSNGSSYSIHFRQCKNVKIISCKFVDFRVRTIMMRDVEAIYFENTMFENCELQYRRSTDDWKILGGVIYTDRPQSVGENKFVNCIFENCGGRNTENYYSTQFISNCKSTLDGCKFNNCWNYRDTNRVDTDDERRRMFPANSSALNCTNIDSANII